MVIYKITNLINGKLYIGQTVSSIAKRWREHKVPNSKCKNLGRAIAKYGARNFKIEAIEQCVSVDQMNELEVKYIKELRTLAPSGYNLREGGENSRHSPEARARMSMAQKGLKLGKPSWNKGKSSWSKGLRFSQAHRAAIAASARKFPVICSNGTVYGSISAAAESLGLSTGKICAVIKGRRKHTKGFTFVRKETVYG